MCNGKKICGTLIENVIEQSWIKSSVIGIGLNINQDVFNGSFSATSLYHESGEKRELKEMLQLLVKLLNAGYEQLLNQKYDEIDREYIQFLFRYLEWANYRKEKEVFEGRITGISGFGELIIEDRLGKESKFGFKEVGFL
jgi:BirA family biotin operon repressor/biotin-[acetyl-CoA-carboxylase] ligase